MAEIFRTSFHVLLRIILSFGKIAHFRLYGQGESETRKNQQNAKECNLIKIPQRFEASIIFILFADKNVIQIIPQS